VVRFEQRQAVSPYRSTLLLIVIKKILADFSKEKEFGDGNP
jgi:hypothetical protein